MRLKSPRPSRLGLEEAEGIAAEAFAFLAADPARLMGFLRATGLELGEVRERAGTREFLSAVLDHLVRDESLLLVFAAEAAKRPESVALAAQLLSGEAFS